jgi:tRNA(Ile)-lysidine synthase TilS/MesJ
MKTKLDCLKLINFMKNRSILKKIFYPVKNILIAYSGGQDSSALLAIFYILSKNGTLILVSSIVITIGHIQPKLVVLLLTFFKT